MRVNQLLAEIQKNLDWAIAHAQVGRENYARLYLADLLDLLKNEITEKEAAAAAERSKQKPKP